MTMMGILMTLMYSGKCLPHGGGGVGIHKKGVLEQSRLRLSLEVLHLFNKYLLSIYYVPDFALGARDSAVNKTDKNNSPRWT